MTRESDVVQTLVGMADTLVDDYDVVDMLTGLADRVGALTQAVLTFVICAAVGVLYVRTITKGRGER